MLLHELRLDYAQYMITKDAQVMERLNTVQNPTPTTQATARPNTVDPHPTPCSILSRLTLPAASSPEIPNPAKSLVTIVSAASNSG